MVIGVGVGRSNAADNSDAATLIKAWSAIPPAELRAAWNDAQQTGGVIVVEEGVAEGGFDGSEVLADHEGTRPRSLERDHVE